MELFLKKREYHLFGFLKKTGLNPSGLKISVLRKEKKPKNSNWIGLNLLFFCFRQKKGLVKKLFFKAFSISVLCFGISLVFLPAGVSASSSDIGALKGKISEYEGVVQKFLNRLNTCRSECISRCREACPMVGETGSSTRQKCLASCTNDKCDKEVCYTVKQNHEKYKGELGKYKKALAEIENKASNPDPETNSPLEQVRREKDDMKIYKAIGAAATAFLGYKTATCCSSKKCRASGRCYLYGAMTAAAALQTSQMGGKKGELRNTELKLCVNDPNSANRCIDDGPGDDGGNGIPEIAPYCKDNPARCDTTGGIFVGCGEGEPECNEETLRKKLRTVLKPPGGWPESIDPFSLDNKGLSHKKLSPAQRRHINQMMEPFNRQNQAYLNKKGLGSKGFTAAGQKSIASSPAGQSGSLGGASGFGSGSYGGPGSGSKRGLTSGSKGLQSSFTGGEAESAASDDPGYSEGGGARGKKGSLADQMKKMLKQLSGAEGGFGDPLAEKSVQFGSDIIGVVEDNIFMMVHRRHRSLDSDNRFIKNAF